MINVGMKEGLMKKLHAPDVKYYSVTMDGWSTNVATHSLISLTARFYKNVCCVVCERDGGLTYWECHLCKILFYAF